MNFNSTYYQGSEFRYEIRPSEEEMHMCEDIVRESRKSVVNMEANKGQCDDTHMSKRNEVATLDGCHPILLFNWKRNPRMRVV